MNYRDDTLRDALAAEFVIGTLRGAARRRFERLLKGDPRLRHAVARWQERLAPLNATVSPVEPPARIWRSIEQRIHPSRRPAGLGAIWSSLGFWRFVGATGSVAALALATYLALLPPPKPQELMVVVMSDDASRPALAVSWPMGEHGKRAMRVRVLGHAEMAPDTAWELWMLPEGEQKPVSLGLVSTKETQTIDLPAHLADAINQARGLAMSVEPAGGSPTGLPTGPVIYKGPLTPL